MLEPGTEEKPGWGSWGATGRRGCRSELTRCLPPQQQGQGAAGPPRRLPGRALGGVHHRGHSRHARGSVSPSVLPFPDFPPSRGPVSSGDCEGPGRDGGPSLVCPAGRAVRPGAAQDSAGKGASCRQEPWPHGGVCVRMERAVDSLGAPGGWVPRPRAGVLLRRQLRRQQAGVTLPTGPRGRRGRASTLPGPWGGRLLLYRPQVNVGFALVNVGKRF